MLSILLWPLLFWIGQFSIIFLFTLIYNSTLNLNSTELKLFIGTDNYIMGLANYLNNQKLWMAFVSLVIFLPLFIFVYRKNKQKKEKEKLILIDYFKLILIGIFICIFFNIVFFNISQFLNLGDFYDAKIANTNLIINIIAVGIIGPILEEFLFRGVIYNLFLKYKIKGAIFLTSLIFAFMHVGISQIIYTFCLSLILIYFYEKYRTLKAPIVIHIFANIINILFVNYIENILNIYVYLPLFFISLVILIYFFLLEFKIKKN